MCGCLVASQAYVVFWGVTVTAVSPHEFPEALLEDEVNELHLLI
ncbi:hypothetical protein EE612_050185 [Oryza sativa]|nr:hypothetical protein EE612_050185 [Oryza sativa]